MGGFPPSEDKARSPMAGVPVDRERLKELLVKYNGNQSKCAKALGCARYTVGRICRDDEDVRQVLDDTRERFIDDIEDTGRQIALDGSEKMIQFFLKTQARARGYSDTDLEAQNSILKKALDFAINQSRSPVDDKNHQEE